MNSAESTGYLIGTLLAGGLFAAAAWYLWKLGNVWSRAFSVFLSLGILGSLGSASAKMSGRLGPSVEDFNREFINGCAMECRREGGDATACRTACGCIVEEIRGTRSPEEFGRWLTEHLQNGKPDSIATAKIKSSAESCFSRQ